MNYGVPYKGGKNKIAEKIIKFLPPAENFYDLFAGGCAVAQVALLSGKYKNVYINDINGGITQLFIDSINGKYNNENRWISREDFFTQKETDAFIKYIWSFSNNGKDYMYSKEIELYKKAYHFAVFGDYSYFAEMGIDVPVINSGNPKECRLELRKWVVINDAEIKDKYIKWLGGKIKDIGSENLQSLQNLQNLQNLENLQRLQNLERLETITRFNKSYNEIDIKPNSVIYCDIPYANTNCGSYNGFNHAEFYEWARQQQNIYISEYTMPEDFKSVFEIEKRCATGKNLTVEKIFIPYIA